MKLLTRVAAIAGAAALLLSSAMASQAATTADAQVNITTGGTLSVAITGANFGSATYSFSNQTLAQQNIQLAVTDPRGNAAGWNVVLSSGDFFGSTYNATTNPAYTFPVSGNLVLDTGSIGVIAGNSATGSGKMVASAINPAASAVKIWQAYAGYGDGDYTLTVPAHLTIPGRTLVDSYKATMTVAITTGP